MKVNTLGLIFGGALAMAPVASAADDKISVLIVDGQNNHKWVETTPVMEAILGETGRFDVSVATAPGKAADMDGFVPDFASYDVVVSNYNGAMWGEKAREAFEDYVSGGGGFVCVHAADNSFPGWQEYNKMIGVGGWGGRSEKSGPYLRFRDGKLIRVTDPGRGGSHGKRHEFVIELRDRKHPITAGLPAKFMHAQDELYDRLRGPAENIEVLGTAFASPDTGGSGEHEPMLMALSYGKGRVFHTTLGHDVKAMSGTSFQETLKRGTEWTATGKVTFAEVGADVLPADKVIYREPVAAK